MAPPNSGIPDTIALTDRTTVAWPVLLTIMGATWYLGTTLSDIRGQLTSLVALTAAHDSRLRAIEDMSAERGPRIKAIEDALRNR